MFFEEIVEKSVKTIKTKYSNFKYYLQLY